MLTQSAVVYEFVDVCFKLMRNVIFTLRVEALVSIGEKSQLIFFGASVIKVLLERKTYR